MASRIDVIERMNERIKKGNWTPLSRHAKAGVAKSMQHICI